jgi:hypothetical protein
MQVGKWDSLQTEECDVQGNEETQDPGEWSRKQIMPVCALIVLSEAAELNPPGSCSKRRQNQEQLLILV